MIPIGDANPTRRTAVVTYGLIAVTVLVFLYELRLQSTGGTEAVGRFIALWGVVPREVSAALARADLLSPTWLTVFSSLFIHAGWAHLLGNMLYLWIFGNNVEDRLGRLGFLLFYLFGGLVAALAQTAIDPRSNVPLVGASGAIAAVLGAYLVLWPGATVVTIVPVGFFLLPVRLPALVVLGFWFVLQFTLGFASLGVPTAAEGGVAIFAHIGGFVAGALIGLLLRDAGGRGSRPGGPWGVG